MTIFDEIGNTPLLKIDNKDNDIYLKYEGKNSFGSSKDRAAWYVLNKLYKEEKINTDTVIIESSSGNMGVALATVCKKTRNKFICVIDPNISKVNEDLIKLMGAETVKVTEPDNNNSYLKNRLKKVEELLNNEPNSYWFNQYGNDLVCEAYEEIGKEMINQLSEVEYVFIAVSSAGTISGISKILKKYNPKINIIAVDVLGSKIFDESTTTKRFLSGIGSSIHSENLKKAQIDEIIMIDEKEGVHCCYELLNNHYIFAGGSSGCVYRAIQKYIEKYNLKNAKIIGLLNDRGDRYLETIYSKEWVKEKYNMEV